jgi:hypothetical protein
MKLYRTTLIAVFLLFVAQAACAADLTVIGLTGQAVTVTTKDLAALPSISATGGPPAAGRYQGPALASLLALVGAPSGPTLKGRAMRDYVVVTGSDGFSAILSLAETDPGMHRGAVIIADGVGGAPLTAKEGPYRLVIEGDLKPARSVRNVVRIELKAAP